MRFGRPVVRFGRPVMRFGRPVMRFGRPETQSPRRRTSFSAAMYGFGGVLTQNYFLAVAYEDAAFGLSLHGAALQVVKFRIAAVGLHIFDG